jgi:DNA-binding transcriptional regulator YdaS (Cro superfamily)
MKILDFLNGKPRQEQEAIMRRAGTTVSYVRKTVSRGQYIGALTCSRIEYETEQSVMRWDLRPNDWWQIWPELIAHPDAPSVPAELQVATASKGFPLGIPSQPQAVRGVNHG